MPHQIQSWCTVAVDGWAVTFGTARRGPARPGPPPRCTKCTQPTHQRPVYQSPWLYNGPLLCGFAHKGLTLHCNLQNAAATLV